VYILLIQDFGLSKFAVREVALFPEKAKEFVSHLIGIRTVIAVVVTACGTALLWLLPISPEVRWLTLSISVGSIAYAWNTSYVYLAYEKMFLHMLVEGSIAVLFMLGGIGVIGYGLGFSDFGLVRLISYLFGVILSLFLLVRLVGNFHISVRKDVARRLTKAGIPFLYATIAIQIYYSMDTILLQVFKSSVDVGNYSAMYKIVLLVIGFTAIFQTWVYPAISRFVKSGSTELVTFFFKSSSQLLLFAGVFFTAFIIGFRKELVLLLYSNVFITQENMVVLCILSISVMLVYMHSNVGILMLATKMEKLYGKITVFAALMNTILNLILIPQIGILGAAISTVSTEICLTIIMYVVVGKQFVYKPYLDKNLMRQGLVHILAYSLLFFFWQWVGVSLIYRFVTFLFVSLLIVIAFEYYKLTEFMANSKRVLSK